MGNNVNLLLVIVFVVFGCVSVYAYLKKRGGSTDPGQPVRRGDVEQERAAYESLKRKLEAAPHDIDALMEAANQAFILVRLESEPERQAALLDEANAFSVRLLAECATPPTPWDLWGWTPMLIAALASCSLELQEKHAPLVLEHLDSVAACAPEDPATVEWWVELLAQAAPTLAATPFRAALCAKGLRLYEVADPRAIKGKARKKLDGYAAILRDLMREEDHPVS